MTNARKTNLFFLGTVSFYIIGCIVILPAIPEQYLSENVAIILSQLFVLFPGIIYTIASRGRALQNVRFKRLGMGNIALLVLLTIFMVPVISLINVISMMFVKNHLVAELDSMNPNPLWLNLLLIAVIPACVEEITFRGLLYTGYRNSVIKRAIFASAAAFGLFHMNVNQFCYATFMGIIFALLYEATGSMFASMIVHLTFNANTVILQRLLPIIEEYADGYAGSNFDHTSLGSQLSNTDTISTFAGYSLTEKLGMVISMMVPACVGGAIACLLLFAIAKRNHRGNHLRQVVSSIFGRKQTGRTMLRPNDGQEYVENNDSEYGGKIVDVPFVIGVFLCVLMMML